MDRGSVVADRFEIEALAGSGGMATVWRALDRASGDRVAIKVLGPRRDEREAERFVREAEILADARHPAIVRYVAHGSTEGAPWLAMEWLEGEDLGERLQREPLTMAQTFALIGRAAEALGFAHKRGIVHRDVKPSNLFLVERDIERVKLLDFGIARLEQSTSTTHSRTTLGTPGYMAPEQARGDPLVDARADVFSLGCVMFECLTGRAAFLGEHVLAVLAKILLEEVPSLGQMQLDAPPALTELVSRMMAKEASERPADGAAVAAALASIDLGAMDWAPRPSERATELTAREQRLLSVVLARTTPETDELAHTLPDRDAGPRVAALRDKLKPTGAQLEPLADGTLIATVGVGGAAGRDQLARAARAALIMRAELLGDVVLATGRALVGERWPVGEAIDRATRLLRGDRRTTSPADGLPRPVRIDEVTAGLLGPDFEVGGDSSGLQLVGERPRPDALRRLLGRPTPCIGRDRELATLESIFGRCVAEATSHAVVLIGAPGLGKSRLRHELLSRLRERGEPVEFIFARGDPMSAGSPLGMLAPALRRIAGVSDGEPAEVGRRKVRARVARHVPAEEAGRVGEFLGELAGVPFPDDKSVQLRAARQDATLMGDQMLRAWEDFLAAECAAQPVVLVLEDLHWGDLPTVRYADAALRHLRDLPLLVLAVAHPHIHDVFPRLWAGRPVTEIAVVELSRKASEKLVREALGADLPAAQVAGIVDRAAGNAFYLEEVIRAVAEGHGDSVPETVLALAQARLEGLESEARRLLRAAAVFGQVFWLDGVMALVGGGRGGETRDWFGQLVDRELIERRQRARFPGQVEYQFRHGLLREAAYAMLTDADRALGHRLAGAWLEHAGETDAIVLAEHFDRGAEPARAINWFRRGAEQAMEGHDFANATALARRGMASGAGGETLGALWLIQAEAARWRGQLAGAREAAREAVGFLGRGCAAWFRAVEVLLGVSGRLGAYDPASRWAREVLDQVPAGAQALDAKVVCLCEAGRQIFHAGDYEQADRLIARVGELADAHPELAPRARAEMHRLRGARARHIGNLGGDVAGYAAALAGFVQAGDERSACNAQVSLGFAHVELGDLARARAELERALGSAERMRLDGVATRARQNLGLVLAAEGRLAEARALEERVIAESRDQGNLRFEGWTRVYLSVMDWQAGDHAAAETEAARAAEILEVTPPARAGALAARSRALLSLGRFTEARAAADEAMATLQVLGGIEEFEPLVRLAHADTLWAAGARGAARGAIHVAKVRIEQLAAELDPTDRAGFLHQVPHNREIVDRAAQWLRTEAPPGAPPVSVAAAHDPEAFRAQGHRLVDRLADYLTAATAGQLPVVAWQDPDAMRARWPAGYPAEPDGDIEALASRLLADSVHQHHPRTAAHQVSAPWPAAVLADLVASLLNNGMAAYDSGPASSAIEAEVLAWLAAQLGLPAGSDGLLTSGGSLGNLTALVVARGERGARVPAEQLAVLCGDQAHYSVRRAVRIMGWGDGGAVPVASDDHYRMRADAVDDALARARAAGRTVIGLVASTGSTATGAIDPIAAIADACGARGLWLHIDGAHGASAVLSERYRGLIAGIERADSVVWDAHKLLHTPALITAVLFRDGGAAVRALATDAPYLYEGGEPGWWDRGLRTIECTKRMMSVVLHATLSLVGTRAIADAVTVGFDRARRLAALLREHGDFELATDPDTNIVVFRYTPAGDAGQEQIRHRLRTDGSFLIGRVRLAGKLWLRTTLMNPLTTDTDLAALVTAVVAASVPEAD